MVQDNIHPSEDTALVKDSGGLNSGDDGVGDAPLVGQRVVDDGAVYSDRYTRLHTGLVCLITLDINSAVAHFRRPHFVRITCRLISMEFHEQLQNMELTRPVIATHHTNQFPGSRAKYLLDLHLAKSAGICAWTMERSAPKWARIICCPAASR